MEKVIEITQDAAAIIENKYIKTTGIYTKGIDTCQIYVFHTDKALIFIHDSAQLNIKKILKLIKLHGKIKEVKIAYGINRLDFHKERVNKLSNLLNINTDDIKIVNTNKDEFSLTYFNNNFYINEEFSTLKPLPNKDKIQTIIELNNFFMPSNEQSLSIDIQYKKQKYTNNTSLKYTYDEMLEIYNQETNLDFKQIYHSLLNKAKSHLLF